MLCMLSKLPPQYSELLCVVQVCMLAPEAYAPAVESAVESQHLNVFAKSDVLSMQVRCLWIMHH